MAFSEILVPYRIPIANAGINMIFKIIGESDVIRSISEWNIKNVVIAMAAADRNKTKFRYLFPSGSVILDSQLYTFENKKKWIKEKIKKWFV